MSLRILFLTNQASYHQMHFARAMVAHLGADNFRIVFHQPTSDARTEMGWRDEYEDRCILRWWQSDVERDEALEWIDNADVVIQGRFPIGFVRARIRAGKLTFACQERLWKKTPTVWRRLSRLPHLIKNYYSVDRANYHFLAIGRYAAADLNNLGLFRGRSWRYGYFMHRPEVGIDRTPNACLQLLWCARLSPVKQPYMALEITRALLDGGRECHLTMIGDGELRTEVDAQINQVGLRGHVTLTGWQTPEQVIEHMRQADVFLMTSHHGEGWGMVVNEAMSNGCCVIASAELGAAAWLIEHGQSGFLYHRNDYQPALERVLTLSPSGLAAMGRAAQQRMANLWCAEVAAERTVALCEQLLSTDPAKATQLYTDGPCSPSTESKR
ncbi:glycosyltransferase family 4 protein [Arenicella chitinivorans]|nr:glycosyltransferase family 4 protein [Arenicella chitinivorans]